MQGGGQIAPIEEDEEEVKIDPETMTFKQILDIANNGYLTEDKYVAEKTAKYTKGTPLYRAAEQKAREEYRKTYANPTDPVLKEKKADWEQANKIVNDRIKWQKKMGAMRSGAIQPMEGLKDPVLATLMLPTTLRRLGASAFAGMGTRGIFNQFDNNKYGHFANTMLNMTSPFLGPFGRGVSIVDTFFDGKDFINNPSWYGALNTGMNFFNYNPFVSSKWDEKIASGWELGDGLKTEIDRNNERK